MPRRLLSLMFFAMSWLGLSRAYGAAELRADALGVVRTGPLPGTFQVAPGVNLNLGSNTVARVFTHPQDLPLLRGPLTKTWTVIANAGRVDVEIAKGQRRAVMIHDALRRGGICMGGRLVIGTREGRTSAANIDGTSVAISEGRISDLPEGTVVDYSDGDAAPARRVLERAKTPTFQSKLWLAPGGTAKISGVSVAKVAGATHYELTIRPIETPGEPLRVETDDPALGFFFELPPGVYAASLRTVSALGIPSGASPEASIRVIGVTLPRSAKVDALGRIHLADSETVQFTHAEGLQVTATGLKRSRAASVPIGLSNHQRTAVLLHKPGSLDSALALLIPTKLSAEVFAGPKLATWPADPIQIEIQLRGDAERPALSSLISTVTLGRQPIQVAWRQVGDRLIGTVSPQELTQPDVLRVQVTDERGVPLGRDFVELIATPRPKRGNSPPLSVAVR